MQQKLKNHYTINPIPFTEERPFNKSEFNTWIVNLESGNFPEGKRLLHSKQGFTPLGVALMIFAPDKMLNRSWGFISGFGLEMQSAYPHWLGYLDSSFQYTNPHKVPFRALTDKYDLSHKEVAEILKLAYREYLGR